MPATAPPTPPTPLGGLPTLGIGGAAPAPPPPPAPRNSGRARKPSTRLVDPGGAASLGRAPTAGGVPADAWAALATVFAKPVQAAGPGFRGPGGIVPPGPQARGGVRKRGGGGAKHKAGVAPAPGPPPTLQPLRRSVLEGLVALDAILAGGGGGGGGGEGGCGGHHHPSPPPSPSPGVQWAWAVTDV